MNERNEILEATRRLSQALVPGALDRTLGQITEAAVEVLPEVEFASISIKHADGRLETLAPTDDLALDLDAAQYELEEGPCYLSAVDTVHVTASDLAHDPRFPRYAEAAVKAGVHAQAALNLFDARAANGALNLYSTRTGSFGDLEFLGRLFAHHSATALNYARQIEQLHEAIETRQLIGQAVGVVMERYRLPEGQAFSFLTRLASDREQKLRLVAQQLLEETNARNSR